ncbi:MAG: WD40 repeat domain-containing protein [Anaerolineae bacterium]|nr:WD40 repeat domain-containing protein [Anaerolineae bacterium]
MHRRYREFLAILIAFIATVFVASAQPAAMDAALADLSGRVGRTVTLNQLDDWSWREEMFGDASLGCPQPGVMYAQVVTKGYVFTLSYGGTIYDYRSTAAGEIFLCTTTSAEPTAVPPPPTLEPRFPTGEFITPQNADAVHEIARVTLETSRPNLPMVWLPWLPSGDRIVVATDGAPDDPTMTSGGVLLYDAANLNAEPERIELNVPVTALATGVLEGRPYILAGIEAGDAVLFPVAPTEAPLEMQPGAGLDRVNAVALSQDMGYAAAAYGAADDPNVATTNVVQIWEASSGAPLRVLEHPAPVTAIAFSPDAQTIATGDAAGTVRFWDVSEGVELNSLRAHPSAVRALAFSPDGTQIVTGGMERFTRIWDVARATRLVEFDNATDDAVLAAAYSWDGRLLATAGGNPDAFTRDNSVRLWDLAARRVVGGMLGHDAAVTGVAFSPDGTQIASISDDGTLRIWGVTDDAAG